MAEQSRLRIWLLVLTPVVLVGAFVAWATLSPGETPRTPASEDAAPVATPQPPPASAPPLVTAALPQPSTGPSPAASNTVVAAAPSAADATTAQDAGTVVQPEPVPELQAFSTMPPGAEQWTKEQKLALQKERLAKVDERIRVLERELKAAQQTGDTKTAEVKRVTLEYVVLSRERIAKRLAEVEDASP